MKTIVLPNKQKYAKNNLIYDLKSNPFDYFICMFKITHYIERLGNTICNLFPMKTNIQPGHVKIDTNIYSIYV